MKPLLENLSGRSSLEVPVWLMRQAGRYLPEYQEIRKKAGSFLKLCYTPELAAEVTLQPIRRFGFDAAILFSDILVVPHAMGVNLDYVEGQGPVLEKVRGADHIDKLSFNISVLRPVARTIQLVRKELPPRAAMIGFAGSPWTVATYMVEGGGGSDFSTIRAMAYNEEKNFSALIDKLTVATVEYLSMQAEAGAEVVQLFESWAGILPEQEFYRWVIAPNKRIAEELRRLHPQVKIIGFPRGAGLLYEAFTAETGIDGVGIDSAVPLEWAARNLQKRACVQGNLDPVLLASGGGKMRAEIGRIRDILGKGPFIFNLGHGILPHTPLENVETLMEEIRR